MNGVIKRLIVVPGISHLFEVVAVLKNNSNHNVIYEDYLVLAQFCIYNNSSKLQNFENYCIDFANIIHQWKNITRLNQEEHFVKLSTQKAQEFITNCLKLKKNDIEEIYIVRNYQSTNHLIINTYSEAKVIIYGDLGYFDSDIPDNEIERYATFLSMPIEFTKIPTKLSLKLIPHKEILHNYNLVIEDVYAKLIDYISILKNSKKNKLLLLTSNHTESGFISELANEIDYYVEAISKYINPDTILFIKGHPRQSLNQAQILGTKIQKEYGIDCIVFDDIYTPIPSELIIKIFEFDKVISLISGTYIYVKYLFNIEVSMGIDENLINKYFRSIFSKYIINSISLMSELHQHISVNVLSAKNIFKHPNNNMINIENPLLPNSDVSVLKYIKKSFIIDTYQGHFKDLSIDKYLTDTEVCICECTKTKYRFFYPLELAGDGQFYEYLQQFDWYYMPWKWEHQKVKERIEKNEKKVKILEIGCAKGSFLVQMDKQGHDCTGLELNTKALLEAQKLNLNVVSETIQEHANQRESFYDIVCSFQVMEHIPNIAEVIEASVKVLKQGGKLFISVPNNASFLGLDNNNPLNLPPHHMGLWEEVSLRNIAEVFGLQVNAIHLEPLQDYHKTYFKSILHRLLEEQYQYYRNKYKMLGRIFFKLFRKKIINRIYNKYPQIENFTIIAEYIKL